MGSGTVTWERPHPGHAGRPVAVWMTGLVIVVGMSTGRAILSLERRGACFYHPVGLWRWTACEGVCAHSAMDGRMKFRIG